MSSITRRWLKGSLLVTLLLVAVVMIMDTLSAWLRRRYIGGAVVPLF